MALGAPGGPDGMKNPLTPKQEEDVRMLLRRTTEALQKIDSAQAINWRQEFNVFMQNKEYAKIKEMISNLLSTTGERSPNETADIIKIMTILDNLAKDWQKPDPVNAVVAKLLEKRVNKVVDEMRGSHEGAESGDVVDSIEEARRLTRDGIGVRVDPNLL